MLYIPSTNAHSQQYSISFKLNFSESYGSTLTSLVHWVSWTRCVKARAARYAAVIHRISPKIGSTPKKSQVVYLAKKYGTIKDNWMNQSGCGMWRMRWMTKASISICNKTSNHLPITTDLLFGTSSTSRTVFPINTKTCAHKNEYSTKSSVDYMPASQPTSANFIDILPNKTNGLISNRSTKPTMSITSIPLSINPDFLNIRNVSATCSLSISS